MSARTPCLIAFLTVSCCLVRPPAQVAAGKPHGANPVLWNEVVLTDSFWKPRLDTNRIVTVPYDFAKCEETGRIANFARAGGLEPGPFQGIRYNDSDVFKVIEGASYTLQQRRDPKLEAYLDALIAKIAAAQEPDGYLYTVRSLHSGKLPSGVGPTRWSFLAHSHELYNVGHLYEAAVAHYRATGKRTLLDVAVRNADLLLKVFGPGKRRDVPGHEEIEIGLVKLYDATQNRRYLELARFFVDQRGRADGHKLYGDYAQDHKPVTEQRRAVGHAVRAGYLYCAMADLAAKTGDQSYLKAINGIWHDVVAHKLYITGGIGSQRSGEAFGTPYSLPNDTAYNETCAAIANALWNHRMFLLQPDSKYIDVLERILYNGALSGISFSGDRFFYPNPLAGDGVTPFNHGSSSRSPWFGTSCCPVNIVRFLPAIPGMVYATQGRTIYANLFVSGKAKIELDGQPLTIEQQTRYPWDGRVAFTIGLDQPQRFALRVRIPGWSQGKPVPSDLYRYLDHAPANITYSLNGRRLHPDRLSGYAILDREWHDGDRLEIEMAMPVRRVIAHPKVDADRNRVALERGPIVYCLEGVDHNGHIRQLALPDQADVTATWNEKLLQGVMVLKTQGIAVRVDDEGKRQTMPATLSAVPYYAWNHRGAGEMEVWIPRTPDAAQPLLPPTLASQAEPSASHVWTTDSVVALHDRREPKASSDQSIPRLTWWNHRGGSEWAQYEWKQPVRVAGVSVYWFDDTGVGQCRVPASWRLVYRDGNQWKPVKNRGPYGVAKDQFNRIEFEPVTTTALRIEVKLQPNFSSGILEWKLD